MGKLSRTKGANFEREVANLLGSIPGVSAKRNLTETREGNTGDVWTNLPFAIQCKVGKNPPVYAALVEATAAVRGGQTPVAFIRRNAGPRNPKADFVCLQTDDFIRILRSYARAGLCGPDFQW